MGAFKKPPQVPFLKGEQKLTMQEAGTTFWIYKVRQDVYEGKNRHVYTITVPDEDNADYLLAMNDNSVRLNDAEAIIDGLAEDPNGVGPCVLAQVEADVPGGWVWSIEPSPVKASKKS